MGSGGHPDRPRPNYSDADYSFNGKILLAAVIVLFVVVLLVVLLHLYARWFWRVTGGLSSRRRGISRRRRFSFGREDPFRLRTVGLDPSVVENLPSFVYKSEDFGDGPLECAVCLCELEENEKGRLLPKCNHSFHIECIDMWFHSHSTCPLCRGSVHPDSPSNVAESGSVQQISGDNSSAEEPIPANRSIGAEIEGNLVESGQTSSDAVWGVRKQMNNVEQPAAASSSRSFPHLAIDMPKRPDGFSSHREDQVYSPNEQSSKSPVARLRSFKRMLSRGKDRKVFPSAPDEGDIEKNDQSQS